LEKLERAVRGLEEQVEAKERRLKAIIHARSIESPSGSGLPFSLNGAKDLEKKLGDLTDKLEKLGDSETPGMVAAKMHDPEDFDIEKAIKAMGQAQEACETARENLRLRRIQSELPREWAILLDEPVVTALPASRNWLRNLALGAAGGLAAGLLLAVPGTVMLDRASRRRGEAS